jgi:purine nucleosidase
MSRYTIGVGILRCAFTALAALAISAQADSPSTLVASRPPASAPTSPSEKVIIDTDIGIDVDDAFALALALRSPELDILGFSTASGDTLARAKIIDRMLGESGHRNIPVAVGVPTQPPDQTWPVGIIGLQRRYGETGQYIRAAHPQAVDFILQRLRQFPGQITLVTIGPLSNIGAMIDKDVDTFRKVKRVVMMGGWIGPVDNGTGQTNGPTPEYNIVLDIHSAQKLFHSGVPIYVMPIDSTIHLALDEVKRKTVFSEATPITDSLGLLYLLWGNTTPILYDAMPVAFTVDPRLCPMQPMHLTVDEKGMTRVEAAAPNAQVCLHSDPSAFFDYFMRRIATPTRTLGPSLAAK